MQERPEPRRRITDVAITGVDGILIAHRLDCPEVQRLVEAGEPVLKLFQMERPLSRRDVRWHTCLED
jgi:hypothetical protein